MCTFVHENTLYFFVIFSSRLTIFSLITSLTNKTEKIRKASSQKYAQNKDWIEKNLKDGNWKQICKIFKKSIPATDPESPISPLSPKRPVEADDSDFGKGKRIKFPNPKYSNPASPEPVNFNIPATLNFDHLGLEDKVDDEDFEPRKKKEPKVLKKKKVNLEETVLAGERCGLTDYQIMMMYNAGSK